MGNQIWGSLRRKLSTANGYSETVNIKLDSEPHTFAGVTSNIRSSLVFLWALCCCGHRTQSSYGHSECGACSKRVRLLREGARLSTANLIPSYI